MKINCYNTENDQFIVTMETSVARLGLFVTSIRTLAMLEGDKLYKHVDFITTENLLKKLDEIALLPPFERSAKTLGLLGLLFKQDFIKDFGKIETTLFEFCKKTEIKEKK